MPALEFTVAFLSSVAEFLTMAVFLHLDRSGCLEEPMIAIGRRVLSFLRLGEKISEKEMRRVGALKLGYI